jgi:hypothetical protein
MSAGTRTVISAAEDLANTFSVYARSWPSMMIGGAACAPSMPSLWGGSRWSTMTFSGSGGEGWRTSFVLRTASSEASEILLHLHRRGSFQGLRPFGGISWIPSALYAHWSVGSTSSVSVSRPREGLRRPCRNANARPSHARSGRALRAWTRSASSITSISLSCLPCSSLRMFGPMLVNAWAQHLMESSDFKPPSP